MPQLSVIVPVYNEANTIREILEKIDSVAIDKEIIVVDDGSCDGTDKVLREVKYNNLKVIHHTSNRGKGAAILTGLLHSVGEFVEIQDADLEYDPNDYLKLMVPIKEARADLVLGARFTKGYRGLIIHRLGNIFLTNLLNMLFNARINDCFTCYKLLRRDTINRLGLKSRSFDIEIEIVSKAIRNKLRIVEIPISYHPRSYSQGKKIRLRDGIWAALHILKIRFTRNY
ncbi:MAG: glycosyltransferase family 2 protein [Candidatus Omnitrophica bacterium]|nr:glycosyltransferase family 2 protein [Candidatus Omnitrophota bacterium]